MPLGVFKGKSINLFKSLTSQKMNKLLLGKITTFAISFSDDKVLSLSLGKIFRLLVKSKCIEGIFNKNTELLFINSFILHFIEPIEKFAYHYLFLVIIYFFQSNLYVLVRVTNLCIPVKRKSPIFSL